jgi:nucleotide-binding universal stress UspA family protein
VDRPFADILVPLDGSPAAERALPPALALVRRTGAPLRVLSRVLADDKEELAQYLAGIADRYSGATDVETQVVDRESIPDAIAEGVGPGTLVCMSSHGRSGLARAVMGSIAEAFLRTLDRPVLMVGPHAGEGPWFEGRIVACVDGSPESERTVEPATQWSTALGLPLWLVEVREAAAGEPPSPGDQPLMPAHAGELAVRTADVEGWDVLHDDDPARALVDFAASTTVPTALLVLATHGRTGWQRLRIGSVTSATVRNATLPTLIVPAAPARVVGERG